MPKYSEVIEPQGSLSRVAVTAADMVLGRTNVMSGAAMLVALITGQAQRGEYQSLYRQYNAGLIKKAQLMAYANIGTRHQRKIANKLLKEDARK